MHCICQRVYDTGFTGIARIDRRLAHQYEVYGEDCIRRAYDHENKHIAYSETPRKPYCFVTKTKGVCQHEACDWGRYRPPATVARMRWYIENEACQATIHYPSFLDEHSAPEIPASGGRAFKTGGEETKWGTPDFLRRVGLVYERSADGSVHVEGVTALQSEYRAPNDAAIEERERWEDEMHRLHKWLVSATPHRTVNVEGTKTEQLPLVVVAPQQFRDEVAEALYGVEPLDAGIVDEERILDAEAEWNARYERFWNSEYADFTDEELQAAYQ